MAVPNGTGNVAVLNGTGNVTVVNGTGKHDSYVIVGAGVFGSSVALHLIRKYPSANVTLVDRAPFPCQNGASWDCNKIIRADYTNLLYMELALEAVDLWRSDPLYQPFYYESGLVWIDNQGETQVIMDNYAKLNATPKCWLSDCDEVKALWGGIHATANYKGVTGVLINESSGWAEAAKALTKVIETAVAAGVKYAVADIKEVMFDDVGSSTGVRTESGQVFPASHVVLATGAYTAKLLADSAPHRKEMQADGRVVAAAICAATTTLSDQDAEYFRQGPVFVQDVGESFGGSIPPNSDNKVKVYRDESFTNTVYHEASGQSISVPPAKEDYGQWDLSPGMKKEVGLLSKAIYGNNCEKWKLEDYRICWDAITPTQDPIICEHPHSKGLYIVTGGSFHSYKFLPTIGKYAVQMMESTLRPALAKTWAWDREDIGSAHRALLPQREMKDV